MLVYIFIKIHEHPQPDSLGSQKNDIIYIYPIVEDIGKDTLNHFLPLRIDLNIPCGQKFQKLINHCPTCQYNDPDECEVVKYTKGLWSPGDIENPPKLIKKARHYINRLSFTNQTIENLLLNKNKTEEQKDLIMSFVNSSLLINKTQITEKTTQKNK